MKTFYRSLSIMAVAVAFFLAGCREAEPVIIYQLTLSEYGVAFDSNGGSRSIDVIPFPEVGGGNMDS